MDNEEITPILVQSKIFLIRGKQVMIDRDLAELYGVETKRITEAVKRNIERFPEEFRFQLCEKEMDELVAKSQAAGIKTIRGYYYPTAKNHMVENFYAQMGFTKVSEDAEGNTEWEFKVEADYQKQNQWIEVNGK